MTKRKNKRRTKYIQRRFVAGADILVRLWEEIFKHLTYWLPNANIACSWWSIKSFTADQVWRTLTTRLLTSLGTPTIVACEDNFHNIWYEMSAGVPRSIWPFPLCSPDLTPSSSPPAQISHHHVELKPSEQAEISASPARHRQRWMKFYF